MMKRGASNQARLSLGRGQRAKRAGEGFAPSLRARTPHPKIQRRIFDLSQGRGDPVRLLGLALAIFFLQLLPARAVVAAPFVQTRLGDHVEELRATLVDNGVPASARITLAAPDAVILANEGEPLTIDSVSYNPATGRFLIRAHGAEGTPLIAIVGAALTPVMLPVPARAIERNEILGEEDLDWIEFADPRASAYIDDADAVIGKAARRPLSAGAPLRKADLVSPTLIKRGATATIVLEAPGLRLTQTAVALANGGAGDLIAFRNVNSDLEFKAVVVANDLAKAAFRSGANLAARKLDQ